MVLARLAVLMTAVILRFSPLLEVLLKVLFLVFLRRSSALLLSGMCSVVNRFDHSLLKT